jgi:hypothetical protein
MRSIPHHAVCFFRDGDKWCAVFGDFVNMQESPAGFGETFEDALNELQKRDPGHMRPNHYFGVHTHVNSCIPGDDSCKRCGHDLRDEIHRRV